MASASQQIQPSAARLLYSEDNFEPYHLRLLTACVNDDSSNLDLLAENTQDLNDPITNFVNKYQADVLGAATGGHPPSMVFHVPSQRQLFLDPQKYGKQFVRDLFSNNVTTSAHRNRVQKQWKNWEKKEMYVYKVCLPTLDNVTWLQKRAKFGAGRSLLHEIRMANQLNSTEQTTDALLESFNNFKIPTRGKVQQYYSKLLDLANKLGNAKPEAQPVHRIVQNLYIRF